MRRHPLLLRRGGRPAVLLLPIGSSHRKRSQASRFP
ncbi:hypothetical protein PVAP13_5NG017600 [Panicum virgatum]|uniref:Uncharacterized protein n=1 Tax=Panicum virgatum TaxID=38727 RepID=A0A8T0RXE5_PANVG|nr:hypothetical protein PVAP13_5NG017600 [Panicum virgatum]